MRSKHWFEAELFTLFAVFAAAGPEPSLANHGWGVDACLTTHVGGEQRAAYLERLQGSGLGWLRERQPEASMVDLQQAGYRVVAFFYPAAKPKIPGNQLPEDLMAVFAEAKLKQRESGAAINAWEMVGEPDIGYCTDLPDRVAAYQKAVYLGLKAGAKERLSVDGYPLSGSTTNNQQQAPNNRTTAEPIVLMSALGMPPGPWLERAARNGLLDYTDAYNFHFYGHARDLNGVIAAHRAAIANILQVSGLRPQVSVGASLPLWITECGIEAVPKDDYLNPVRRQLQADFTISTAKQALAVKDVAVFMPFILMHKNDPYAMTLSATQTLPAWDAYSRFTRENPWPQRPLAREPHEVNPIVVQWLPDNSTCVPHKVSGTYRFKEGQPIKGELRVYNFSKTSARGRISTQSRKDAKVGVVESGKQTSDVRWQMAEIGRSLIEIPAMGMVSVPVEFSPVSKGYFRETFSAKFIEVGRVVPNAPSESKVSFGLEAEAKIADFTEEPIALAALPKGVIRFPQIEPYVPGARVGVWSTINGLNGEAEKLPVCSAISAPGAPSGLSAPVSQSENRGQTPGGQQPATARSQVSSEARFWIEKENTDPLAPAMAVASVDGLPSIGFLRLQLDKPMTRDRKVLVVLVDDRGQRYTIWENFGADYYGSRSDIWLNLEDFHADFWGPMSADYQFHPERIREVHLRFYLNTANDPVGVKLSLLKARSEIGYSTQGRKDATVERVDPNALVTVTIQPTR